MSYFPIRDPWITRLQQCFILLALLCSISNGQGRDEDLSGLFPVVFNLATRARISTNATCGEVKPEVFCKLVDHTQLMPADNLHCALCDARSNILEQRHPIRNAVDGSERWWQSPSLANGPEFNEVSITLDLGQIYQIAYIVLKAANSPRPGNWILERSLDGVNYKPWQYFAMGDQECRNVYGIEPTIGVPTSLADDQVICTSRYSALNPVENGEIFVSLVNGRPGVFQPSPVLLDFTSAKHIRLRFQKIRTLHADLMSFRGLDPSKRDPSVTRRYFYSVKDISIGGQCICYGHAAYCRRHTTEQDRLQCQCLHNTAGDNCEYCLPKFNQKPWQVGGIQNIGCEECNCHGKSDECVYNATVDAKKQSLNTEGRYEGGGVCLNCKEFTTGVNCEKCVDGYYRRPGMTPDLPRPCQRCQCVETATATSQCVPDDSQATKGLRAGDCICKEGFTGRSCDQCAIGYFGFPRCRICKCNAAGTIDPEHCDLPCSCKDAVEGSQCDRCKPGHFNLQRSNPLGCTDCFCFGVSRSCKSVGWGLSKVLNVNGWVLSTLKPGGLTLLPRLFDGWLEAKTYLLRINEVDPRSYSQDDIHYWNAPMTYLGNRLSSYGGNLVFVVKYILDSKIQNQYHLREPNVVLEGSNISLTTNKEFMREYQENLVSIPLHEDSWYHLESGIPATRDDLMTLLYGLNRLLIRATYHTAQDTVYLKDVVLDAASMMVMDGSSLLSVEQCRCPTGYTGLSCESCSPGWRRVNNQLHMGRCVKCECNNHASECDPYTGVCQACQDSTAGDNCDRCLPGFYGDPRYGTKDDCKPCACPLVSGNNFFAEKCVARPTPSNKENYECLNCQEGYTGARCEECAPGYYGNPIIPGGFCRRCSCGGNIQQGVVGNCNKRTGVCIFCANNTEGEHCERCRRGYYGSAVNGDCRPCECSYGGSVSSECDPRTGDCTCRGLYAGRKCDRCQRGYGNVAAGCTPCNCDTVGSTSTQCDPISGQCPCRTGVDGTDCNKCQKGYYGFSRAGCRACDCYGPGTNNSVDCDTSSGSCICKPNVEGKKCDACKARHFGILSGSGCSSCDCDGIGSKDMQCAGQSGQCSCKPGVGGLKCSTCQPGHFGFSTSGCRRCNPCTQPGHVCDPITGQCACPPNTEGPNCEKCVTNCWGHNKDQGCKPCNCSNLGSVSQQCDLVTGQCPCVLGHQGFMCDSCLPGYYNASSCQPCQCNSAGVVSDTCDRGVCECDGIGQCFCKENVMGKQCDRCRPGTFSLDRLNPSGCTECYCFFRGRSCRQAPYVWTKMDIPSQEADLVPTGTGDPVVDEYGYLVINGSKSSVPDAVSNKPLFWKLSLDLPSDLTLSYNGRLSFIHYFEGTSNLPMVPAPLVVIVGNGFIIQTGSTNLEAGNPLEFNIPLHENAWTVPDRQEMPIERRLMMVVLQNVEAIYIRAAQDGKATFAEIGTITLQTAVPPGPNVTSTLPALGIELCDCPKRYSGESCQNPGEGYHRVKPEPINKNPISPENVVGDVKKCICFEHSDKCDPNTGECLDCQHNTAGDMCDICAPGFYGVATMGKPDDCKPCACPLEIASNNFSPTCTGGNNAMMCTDCQDGYIGMTCDKCAPGYYGDPKTVNDTCKPCGCNPDGSRSDTCDPITGQCPCLSGVSGRGCDQCQDTNFGVVDGKCVSCYTGCTGILLDDIANLTVPSHLLNASNVQFPWQKLYEKERQVGELKDKNAALEAAGKKDLDKLSDEIIRHQQLAEKNVDQSQKLCNPKEKRTSREACETEESTKALLKEAKEIEKEVNKTFSDIKDLVEGLEDLMERLLFNQTSVNLVDSLEKAKKMMEDIENRNFTGKDDKIKEENKLAEKLSEDITTISKKANLSTSDAEQSLNVSMKRLDDIANITYSTYATTSQVIDKIDAIRDMLVRLKSVRDEIKQIVQDAEDINDENKKTISDAEDNRELSGQQLLHLDMLLEALTKKINDYNSSVQALKDKMDDAYDHVKGLIDQAAELEKLFDKTRNLAGDAVKAAKAYKAIVDAIKEAKKSADAALKNAKKSVDISKVSDLEKEVERLMKKSREQLKESADLKKDATGLNKLVDGVNQNLTEAEKTHKKAKDTKEELKKKLAQLQPDLDSALKKIKDTNEDTQDKIDKALNRLKNYNSSVADKLKEIKKFDIDDINFDVDSDVKAAKDEKKKADGMLDLEKKVEKKAQDLVRKTAHISSELDRLKEKIRDARSRVNDMKMSLQSDGKCHRTYRSPLSPSSTNEIRLGFKLNNSSPDDMLIVLLQQSPQQGGKEFIAAEVKNKMITFTWNSGKGRGSVSHPQVLTPQKWYRMVARRVGSVGQLKVWDIDETTENKATQEMSTTGAGCSLMNLNEESTIMLAGSSDLSPLPPDITRQKFVGCLGDINLDTNKVGVYNFKTNEPQHCSACKELPQFSLASNRLYVFSGYGFAQFATDDGYTNKHTKVELKFKTFYEDSHIFFVGNPELGDYVSLQLNGGHVVVRVFMGGASVYTAQSKRVYNSNKWATVIFERKEMEAALIVNRTDKTLFTIPGTATGLELRKAPMFFGGIPSKFKTDNFRDFENTGLFFGCMEILAFGTLAPNEDTSTLVNAEISPSCRENGIHNVGFRGGDAYIILKSDKILFSEQKNDISMNFVTKQPNGVLLVAKSTDPDPKKDLSFYSIHLIDGKIEARMKSDTTPPIVLKSSGTFNDGKMHCVSIVKDGRTTKLIVNDNIEATADSRDIANLGALYLGGLPVANEDIVPSNIDSLDGCISDVIVNGALLSMSDATQYKKADVGRCSFTDKFPEAQLADLASQNDAPNDATATLPSQSCVTKGTPNSETDAKSVANDGSFYAEITKKIIKKRQLVRDFKFTVEFRTFYPDGVFGYVLNNAKDTYLGIQLKGGKVQVKHNYFAKPMQAEFTPTVNDGKWHKLSVEKVKRVLKVTVDGNQEEMLKVPNKLRIEMPLYLGGPKKPDVFTDNNIDLVLHSVRGCLRNFMILDQVIDVSEQRRSRDVGQCYKKVEQGASFGGDAWGAIRDSFEIAPQYKIQLKFRTAQENGVLLASSSSDGKSGLSLELHEGKVKLSFLQDSKMTTVQTSNLNQYDYCGDSWHSVDATLDKDKLTLSVDNSDKQSATVSGGIRQTRIDHPLFFGGFPSGFKSKSSLAQEFFNGCIRDVVLNKIAVDWYTDVVNSKNIRKTACPL